MLLLLLAFFFLASAISRLFFLFSVFVVVGFDRQSIELRILTIILHKFEKTLSKTMLLAVKHPSPTTHENEYTTRSHVMGHPSSSMHAWLLREARSHITRRK